MKYRKRPVVVDAILVSDAVALATKSWKELPYWLAVQYEQGNVVFLKNEVSINTLEGTMKADKDDWIIRGVQGEIYPCKPDIFEATYDRVDEP